MGFSHRYAGKTKIIILWHTVEWNYGVPFGARSKILGVGCSQVLLWSRVSIIHIIIYLLLLSKEVYAFTYHTLYLKGWATQIF